MDITTETHFFCVKCNRLWNNEQRACKGRNYCKSCNRALAKKFREKKKQMNNPPENNMNIDNIAV